MYEIRQNEPTAAYRTIFFVVSKTSDSTGYTSNLLPAEIQLFKPGAAGEVNATNGSTHIANGTHRLVLTPTELDTLGHMNVRLAQATCFGDSIPIKVVAFNAFDAASMGLSNLSPTAILTAANGIFPGRTLQRAIQSIYSQVCGKTAGRGSPTEVFYSPADGVTPVITHTYEADGDRNTPTEP